MPLKKIDLNCDMGEGFGHWLIGDGDDDHILNYISSANIAAGFHAGDPDIMNRIVAAAVQHNVGIGVHPGFQDLRGFGRRHIQAETASLVNDVIYQMGALEVFARLYQVPLAHIKLHGALFMHAARDHEFAQLVLERIHALYPDVPFYCLCGSASYQAACTIGHPVVREFYADRAYDASGLIVFSRNSPEWDVDYMTQRVLRACMEGKVRTVEGLELDVSFDSICFHSDTHGALAVAKSLRDTLTRHDIQIARRN